MIYFPFLFFILFLFSKKKSFFSFWVLLLMVSPSVKVFGIENFASWNMTINNYLFYLIFPVFILYKCIDDHEYFHNIVKKFNTYKYLLYILLMFSISALYYLIFIGTSNIFYPFFLSLSFYKGIICVLLIIYFNRKTTLDSLFDEFKRILIIIFIFSVIVGAFQIYFSLPGHQIFVNLYDTRSEILNYSVMEMVDINFHRVLSIFSWNNQYAAFLAFSVVLIILLNKRKVIRDLFVIIIAFTGFLQSSSRTGMLLLLIASGLSFLIKYKVKAIIIVAILLLFSVNFFIKDIYFLIDERITNFVNDISSNYYEAVYNDRVSVWILRYNELLKDPFLFIFGSWYVVDAKDYLVENGFLYVFIVGGVVTLTAYFLFFYDFLRNGIVLLKKKENRLSLYGISLVIVSIIFLVAELSMTWYSSFRITEILSFTYGFGSLYVYRK